MSDFPRFEGSDLFIDLTVQFAPTFEKEDEFWDSVYKDSPKGRFLLRTNSVDQKPAADVHDIEWTRVEQRLSTYGLRQREIAGDGNCQFASVSDRLYGTPQHHPVLRNIVVQQLKSKPELYKDFVPEPFDEYLDHMSKLGEWGDNVTLQAVSDYFGVTINIISSYPTDWLLQVQPRERKSTREIWLCFWAEYHYNALEVSGNIFTGP